eukprot:GHVO01065560.1.p1 GENE.GHVO01065560.1~~GHVO01065560.1.p1  ORF type:complete len:277 (+),score=38.31 GHVO01065560.1:87-917(+)
MSESFETCNNIQSDCVCGSPKKMDEAKYKPDRPSDISEEVAKEETPYHTCALNATTVALGSMITLGWKITGEMCPKCVATPILTHPGVPGSRMCTKCDSKREMDPNDVESQIFCLTDWTQNQLPSLGPISAPKAANPLITQKQKTINLTGEDTTQNMSGMYDFERDYGIDCDENTAYWRQAARSHLLASRALTKAMVNSNEPYHQNGSLNSRATEALNASYNELYDIIKSSSADIMMDHKVNKEVLENKLLAVQTIDAAWRTIDNLSKMTKSRYIT